MRIRPFRRWQNACSSGSWRKRNTTSKILLKEEGVITIRVDTGIMEHNNQAIVVLGIKDLATPIITEEITIRILLSVRARTKYAVMLVMELAILPTIVLIGNTALSKLCVCH